MLSVDDGRADADAVAIAAAPISISLRLTFMMYSEDSIWATLEYRPISQIGMNGLTEAGPEAKSVAP